MILLPLTPAGSCRAGVPTPAAQLLESCAPTLALETYTCYLTSFNGSVNCTSGPESSQRHRYFLWLFLIGSP